MSARNAPHSLVTPSIWMLMVGYPKREVHSRGKMPLLFAMQLRSMYPTYLEVASRSLTFRRVFSKRGLLFVQYMLDPISPVDGPMFFGNSRLCSKLMLMG